MPKRKLPNSKTSKRRYSLANPNFYAFIIGLILILYSGIFFVKKISQPIFFGTTQNIEILEQSQATHPKRLKIPRLEINLPISEAEIVRGNWQVSDVDVSHLKTSAVPGQKGSIILYGHNKKQLLGKLHLIKVGDQISVTAADFQNYRYEVREIKIVSPTNIAVLESRINEEVLIIYTCAGFLDSQRLVVKAKPI